jgi:hypothetical protein
MPDAQTRKLKALLSRRIQLLVMIVAEGNRSTHAIDVVRRGIVQIVKCLKKQLAEVDRELEAFIRETPVWSAKAKLLRSVPGVGQLRPLPCLPSCRSWGGLTEEDRRVGRCRAVQSRQRYVTWQARDLGWPIAGPRHTLHVHANSN